MYNSEKCNPSLPSRLSPFPSAPHWLPMQVESSKSWRSKALFMLHKCSRSCEDSNCLSCHTSCYMWLQALHLFFLRSINLVSNYTFPQPNVNASSLMLKLVLPFLCYFSFGKFSHFPSLKYVLRPFLNQSKIKSNKTTPNFTRL